MWNRLCFGDILGNIRACFFVDVFDPIQADIMMQDKMETVLVEEFLNKQGRQGLMHKEGLALEEKSVHLLKHTVREYKCMQMSNCKGKICGESLISSVYSVNIHEQRMGWWSKYLKFVKKREKGIKFTRSPILA